MILVSEALSALAVENYKLEGNPSNETEFNASFVKFTGSDENGVAIESTDPADFGVTWAEVSAKMTALVTEKPLAELRAERDRRIAETDWWVLSDRTATQAQLDYRQALRDITNTYTSLDAVVWPTKP
tara:strand:- start:742 stop:1125 length:384 start_codon:yes stop_codon:yes gene_type:complete